MIKGTTLKILAPGTEVTIEQANIPGKISQVNIKADYVTYEVTYYVDFAQRTVNCSERELQVNTKNKRMTVGFK
jgi:hypothetical protein